jgi:hypothetical protein
LDRLNAPNDAAGFAALSAELEPLSAKLFGPGATIEKVGEPRDPLTARVKAKNAPESVADLLARLG